MIRKNNKGFTLIEILVVIGIIAVLAAIVLIAINPARQFAQARNTQRTSNVEAVLNAFGQRIADFKGDLDTDAFNPALTTANGTDASAWCDDLVPTYMPAMPTDPDSGHDGEDIADCADLDDTEYTVTYTADERIEVCALLTEDVAPEGEPETEDICVTR